MNTATTPKAQIPDIAAQITYAMRTMGVPPIPRNYELFYEAYIGSNPTLTRELAALGSKATQEELDELGQQYFGNHQSRVIENAHSKIISELDGLLHLLKQEQTSLESYNKLLGETYSRINTKNTASVDILRSAITLLTEATDTTMAHGEQTVEQVTQKSQEMDQVRKELDEYKRIANTDSLTRIANRRAFDERLASIYNASTSAPLTSLVLADIDNFKKINDTYGHPVGDKILATVATVIRANVRKDCFVARTGGEEFAIIIDGNTAEEVNQMCERVRSALETTPFKNSRTGVNYGPITLSLGFCMAGSADDPGELYSKADIALYCAKHAGRNRTKIFEDGMKKDFTKSWLIYRR
ncbi:MULTISPECIES: GGDEF domain-containing protein [Alphaproteobacteria]|uniref:diguanylate cyclase n=2 Tax=Alphaproteobacteria TaxID=28211 RepID=A0A512HCE4_9HYPH|nr:MULTISPECIES: GGDEF domain-containing protein [Alphaproteobacteria]GEO83114.1 GGDEF domain-containing protein [Ciceribacter naphthalenivorans]GLR20490.1 GGDEF domain-containing protein [Ciceribacter naphthalenivorans]GLT03346.1 GGDEF domain-containing protein [Sphingomonas psychrolutea]